MTANELRIGNYLLKRDETFQISGQDIFNMWSTEILREPLIYSPIEITEEWLLRFGFWKKEDSNVWNNAAGNYRYCIHQTGMLYPFDVRVSNGSYFIYTPKYVHQLQNLFWCLVGEELTIKNGDI